MASSASLASLVAAIALRSYGLSCSCSCQARWRLSLPLLARPRSLRQFSSRFSPPSATDGGDSIANDSSTLSNSRREGWRPRRPEQRQQQQTHTKGPSSPPLSSPSPSSFTSSSSSSSTFSPRQLMWKQGRYVPATRAPPSSSLSSLFDNERKRPDRALRDGSKRNRGAVDDSRSYAGPAAAGPQDKYASALSNESGEATHQPTPSAKVAEVLVRETWARHAQNRFQQVEQDNVPRTVLRRFQEKTFEAGREKWTKEEERAKEEQDEQEAAEAEDKAVNRRDLFWNPKRKLSREAMKAIRLLHAEFPEEYTKEVLAAKYRISYQAVRRIIRSRYSPEDHHLQKIVDKAWAEDGRDSEGHDEGVQDSTVQSKRSKEQEGRSPRNAQQRELAKPTSRASRSTWSQSSAVSSASPSASSVLQGGERSHHGRRQMS